jgi:hypothetical protein
VAPGETGNPLSAINFIDNSNLRWAHDESCSDHEHESRGQISKVSLGAGSYSDRQKTGFPGCNDKGSVYDSNDDAAPHDSGGPADAAEGFFMDLLDSWRNGQTFTNNEPVYVRRAAGEYVQYWFHWGESNLYFLDGYAHEGDWEHISIKANSNNQPQQVEYHYHHDACRLAWADAPKYNGRPVIWAADESHGSYPAGADAPSYDRINGDGPLWTTAGNLDLLAEQDWWPYGGAWGEVGTSNETTGPQGPHPTDNAPQFTSLGVT